ncbi:Actin-depolymerizing factor 6 [Morella rubra]|uniref:Actin-depolymerizing factor 6 n=1 Tax=Morella rubra TaxID=262757 RepID=A0A6A1W218_9ROSI|nr:Actin-depolymerizing factor 6 [Morella rubra]
MGVSEHSKTAYLELQRKKMHRYIIFKIDEKKKEVLVEKTGGPAESYDDFTASLPENDCRYAVYDFDFVTSENCQKSKIFFIAWPYPDDMTFVNLNVGACSSFIDRRVLINGMAVNSLLILIRENGCLIKSSYIISVQVILKTDLGKGLFSEWLEFVFVCLFMCLWSPSVSRIRAKMLYATSKDRFRRELEGIHYEIQATDPTEMDLEVLRDRAN